MYETYTTPCGIPMTNYWDKYDTLQKRIDYINSLKSNETQLDNLI